MASLEIRLFGRPQIKFDGQIIDFNANKALALFYYLAVTKQAHSRQVLAGLLWSDLAEDKARRNLRVELNRLKNLLEPYLLAEYETIAFNPTSAHWVDVLRFDALLKQPDVTLQQLQEAIELYHGQFLDDFHVRDAALFEEWMSAERTRLLQAVQRATLRLAKLYTQQRQYGAAIACINQLLAREPWLEDGHQQLMRLYALTGQRSEALKQYETLSKVLVTELGADVLPAQATEDLYDQIVNEEIQPDLADEPTFTFSQIPLPPPFQAPQALLHFVGREQDLAQLRADLLRPGSPLWAVVGMGGLGKSALAGRLAYDLRAEFPDGVLWAHVATSDPLDILGNWSRAFGYDFSTLSDVENRAAALRGVLAEKRVLIILDDVRSAARARALLLGGAHCAMLLTTRDHDIAVALTARPYRLREFAPEEGVRLLTRILGEERVAAEPEAAQAICTQLQNLPLAVEITAQRLVSRGRRKLADMAQRLRTVEERLDLSISDRAVRTSFMVSWEALDFNLRHAFERLAVFEGRSFTAAVLAHIGEMDLYTAEDRLFELQRLSLVSEAEDDRYRQHPLLADFAREQLGDNIAPLVDMAVYYQQFADRNRSDYSALRPEWDNLMAGMETAHKLAQWHVVLAYAETLTQAWFVRARYAQARQGYALAREAAQAVADERSLANCLLKLGQACLEQADYSEAEGLLDGSKGIYEKMSDAEGVANAQYQLARIAIEQSSYEKARQLLIASQNLREQLADQIGVAATIHLQALVHYRQGDRKKAKALCEDAWSIQEQASDFIGMLPTLRLLADVALDEAEYDAAEKHCKQALHLCEQLQNRGEMAGTYYLLTVIARCQRKLELAQNYAEKVLEHCDLIGDMGLKALTLFEIGKVHAGRGDHLSAISVALTSINLLRKLQEHYNLVYVLRDVGDIYEITVQREEARMLWAEALEIAVTQNHPLVESLQKRLIND